MLLSNGSGLAAIPVTFTALVGLFLLKQRPERNPGADRFEIEQVDLDKVKQAKQDRAPKDAP